MRCLRASRPGGYDRSRKSVVVTEARSLDPLLGCLHAKCVVLGRTAWIGSANASRHSRDRLYEASLQMTDSAVAGEVRRWIADRAAITRHLGQADLRDLISLKPKIRRPMPGSPTSVQIPSDTKRLLIPEFDDDPSREAHEVARRTQTATKAAVGSLGNRMSSVDWFEWWPSADFKVGDWVIDVTPGQRVARPVLVHSIVSFAHRRCIVWYIFSEGRRVPPRRELLNAALGSSDDVGDDGYLVPHSKVKSVLALYNPT